MLENFRPSRQPTCFRMPHPPTESSIHPCQIRLREQEPSRQSLVLQYLPLVRMIACQIYGSLPAHASVEMSDVVQAGHVGLVNASYSYRAGEEVPFSSFARHRIRGEILDSLRKLDSASRGLRRWQRRLDAETRNLTSDLCREPSEEELSERLGVEIESLRKRRLHIWNTCSCNSPLRDSRDSEAIDRVLAGPDSHPDRLHQHGQTVKFLVRAVSVLPPRSRKVVLLYYLRSMTMKQIGVVLNVNESRVSQIHKHALKTMSRGLRAAGVMSLQDL